MAIHLLDPITSNKIAAGEVVERPCAVVKELVENAMDAGADQITVEVRQGGKIYIRVTDNGCGIAADDLPLAFERHATSKIEAIEDLDRLQTLGFRGEALASISSVSLVELITRHKDAESGSRVDVQGGKILSVEPIGAAVGTTLIIRDLFYNTPARLKFLKSNGAELSAITEWISRLAVSRPEISFRYIADQQDIFMTTGNGSLKESVASVYERALARNLVAVEGESSGVTVRGFVGDLNSTRGNRQLQLFFVNGRSVRSSLLSDALEMGFQTLLPVNRYPVCFIHIELEGSRLDINIHPAKTQIRFQEEQSVRQTVYQLIRDALLQRDLVPSIRFRQDPAKEDHTAPATVTTVPPAVASVSKESFRASTVNVPSEPPLKPAITPPVKPASDRFYDVSAKPKASEAEQPYGATPQSVDVPGVMPAETPLMPAAPDTIPVVQDPVKELTDNTQEEDAFLCVQETQPTWIASETQALPELNLDTLLRMPEPTLEEILPEPVYMPETLYDNLTIIGQLFRTYILAEKDEALYLIDQHAAHEKVLFETFMNQWRNHTVSSQLLLVPEVMHLEPSIIQHGEDLLPVAAQMGFEADVFGVDALVVRAVPMVAGQPLPVALLQTLMEDGTRSLQAGKRLEDVRAEQIIRESCKKAIKADDSLETLEIRGLLEQLKTLESPYTCPHGRPIIVRMEKGEIERRFKRT